MNNVPNKKIIFSNSSFNIDDQTISNLNNLTPEQKDKVKLAMNKLNDNPIIGKMLGGGIMDMINIMIEQSQTNSSNTSTIIDVPSINDSISNTDSKLDSNSNGLLNQPNNNYSSSNSSNNTPIRPQNSKRFQQISSTHNPGVKSDQARNIVLIAIILLIIGIYLQITYHLFD